MFSGGVVAEFAEAQGADAGAPVAWEALTAPKPAHGTPPGKPG